MDDGIDVAQGRRPVGVGTDLADDARFGARIRFLQARRGGATLRQHETMARRQYREEGAADEAACAGDENSAHRAIIGKQSDRA